MDWAYHTSIMAAEEARTWLRTANLLPIFCVTSYTYSSGLRKSCRACDKMTQCHVCWYRLIGGPITITACKDCYGVFQANMDSLRDQCMNRCTTTEDLKEAFRRKALLLGLSTNPAPQERPDSHGSIRCTWRDCSSFLQELVFAKKCKAIVCLSCLAEIRSLVDPDQPPEDAYHTLAKSEVICTRSLPK